MMQTIEQANLMPVVDGLARDYPALEAYKAHFMYNPNFKAIFIKEPAFSDFNRFGPIEIVDENLAKHGAVETLKAVFEEMAHKFNAKIQSFNSSSAPGKSPVNILAIQVTDSMREQYAPTAEAQPSLRPL